MHSAHTTANTHARTHTHKFSHSAEPFLKPGLIFVWIIGLCAYRLHHIGRLKPYYQPIEWRKKGFWQAHIVTHSQASFTKTLKHLFNMQQKHTFSSWNAPRHDSKNQGLSRASQKFEAGSASFILKAPVIIACFFFPLFPSRESKQILLWKCYWLWIEATILWFFSRIWMCNNIMWNLFNTNGICSFRNTYSMLASLYLLSSLSVLPLTVISSGHRSSSTIDQLSSTLLYISVHICLGPTSLPHLCMFLAPSAHIQGGGDGWVHAEIEGGGKEV